MEYCKRNNRRCRNKSRWLASTGSAWVPPFIIGSGWPPRRAGPCFPLNRSAFSTKKRLYYGARTNPPLSLSHSLFPVYQTPFPAVLYLYLSRRMNHTSIFTHQPCRWYTENWSDSSYGLLTHSIFVPIVVVQTFDDEKMTNVSVRDTRILSRMYVQLLHLIFQLIIIVTHIFYIFREKNQSYKPFKRFFVRTIQMLYRWLIRRSLLLTGIHRSQTFRVIRVVKRKKCIDKRWYVFKYSNCFFFFF